MTAPSHHHGIPPSCPPLPFPSLSFPCGGPRLTACLCVCVWRRWAGLQAEFNDRFSDLRYGYGYMRAPWSMNPSPYISRFAKDSSSSLPSCNSHYGLVTAYDKMMDFFYMSSFAPHATGAHADE